MTQAHRLLANTLAVLALLGIFTPAASASFTDVRSYQEWIYQAAPDDGVIAQTAVTVPPSPHGFSIAARRSTWELSISSTSIGTIPVTDEADFQFEVDGTDIAGCTWHVHRSLTNAGLALSANYLIRCQNATAVNPGTHTIEVKVTVTSGSNPVIRSRIDILLLQTDSITDATLDHLHNEIHNQATTTNNLINTTHTHIDNHITGLVFELNAIFGRLNTTCQKSIFSEVGCEGVGLGNVSVNNTGVLEALHNGDVEVAQGIAAWVVFMLIAALIIWAEKTKDLLVYIAAVIAITLAVPFLWVELGYLTLIIVGIGALVAYRGFEVWQTNGMDE